jgi:hypothetical protein
MIIKTEIEFEVIQLRQDTLDIIILILTDADENFKVDSVNCSIDIERGFDSVITAELNDYIFVNKTDSLFMVMTPEEYNERYGNK